MSPSNESSYLNLFVRQIRYEGRNIQSYELVDADGAALPAFTAGAHIDIHLDDGLIRQYSLCNAPAERFHYVIAVLRDERGRGGSKSVHERLNVQDSVRVSLPRNHFELGEGASKVILLAGGIGVTPLKAMAHQLQERGVDCTMHYCARDANAAAFIPELQELLGTDRLQVHFDEGDSSRGLDIAALLRDERRDGTHIYYCGPAGFMKACEQATAEWPRSAVHSEYFKAPELPPAPAAGDNGSTEVIVDFTVEIATTGQRLDVPPDKSIAQVLRDADIQVETSCEAGLCATCKVHYLSGDVDHRDCILSEDEQKEFLTVCVSRATGALLVLDL